MDQARPLDADRPEGPSLLIDALFGCDLKRPIPFAPQGTAQIPNAAFGKWLGAFCDSRDAGSALPSLAERIAIGWPPTAAIDILSGLDAASGAILAPPRAETAAGSRAWCAAANLTVTFQSTKPGHLAAEGPRHCSKLVNEPIGL
ncbi:NAD(P)H-hydrate epimerase [Thioclava pacifica]|uniref:NAD(P)H-hydrate epimerase n=1 Tax=Thioclava pacifica TaxID=285109 RepID=UPI000A02F865